MQRMIPCLCWTLQATAIITSRCILTWKRAERPLGLCVDVCAVLPEWIETKTGNTGIIGSAQYSMRIFLDTNVCENKCL